MVPRPNELDEIRWRMRVTNLEARIELREIDAAAFTREIASPLTPATRRTELIARRAATLTEVSKLKAELDLVRRSFPTDIPGH
jgi:hypothetical protein